MDNRSLSKSALLERLQFDKMTPRTRAVLFARIEENNPAPQPKVLTAQEFAIARAVADVLIPQNDQPDWRVDLASDLDLRLSKTIGKGWRYDVLPPETEMYKSGLRIVDEMAQTKFQKSFCDLNLSEKTQVVEHIEKAREPVWVSKFFEELLAGFVEAYYAHPLTQASIGCTSMVDIRK